MKNVFISTDFFYRSSNRGKTGVDWYRNEILPLEVRQCKHGISIPKDIIVYEQRMTFTPERLRFVADIYYYSKRQGRKIFKGQYVISMKRIDYWIEHNGYYATNSGDEILVIPVVLWQQTKESENLNKNNLKLI